MVCGPEKKQKCIMFHSHKTCGLSVESLKVSGPPICLEGPDGSIRKEHSKGLHTSTYHNGSQLGCVCSHIGFHQ